MQSAVHPILKSMRALLGGSTSTPPRRGQGPPPEITLLFYSKIVAAEMQLAALLRIIETTRSLLLGAVTMVAASIAAFLGGGAATNAPVALFREWSREHWALAISLSVSAAVVLLLLLLAVVSATRGERLTYDVPVGPREDFFTRQWPSVLAANESLVQDLRDCIVAAASISELQRGYLRSAVSTTLIALVFGAVVLGILFTQ
jgi:hypothetical protein